MIKTEQKALGKEHVVDNLELLEFKVQKSKCIELLSKAVQIWKAVLD